MNGNPFVSVVMPIYNVEKYIRRAIDCVLQQSFQDFELILVDDCSPDACPSICDEYAEKFENIMVIHHSVNKGLSEARNSGLEKATGEYIWFMDSDDSVDNDLIEKVFKSIEKNRADVVVFGLIEEYFDKNGVLKYTKTIDMPERLLVCADDVHEIVIKLEENTLYGYAWNKFYNLKYLKELGLKYEVVTLIEDIQFNVKYFQEIKSLNLLSITPYHYGKRIDNGLTSKFVEDYFVLHETRVKMIYEQYQRWGCCNEDVKKKLANIYARYILSAMQRNCDKRSGFRFIGRYKWNKTLFNSEFFNELNVYMEPKSGSMSVIMPLIRNKQSLLCMSVGRVVFIVKNKLPILFAKAKESK